MQVRFLKIRQFILGFFLAIALLFAFEAGEKGVEHNRHSLSKTRQKLFKSFPLFNSTAVPGEIQTQSTQEQVKSTEETKKEEEKKELQDTEEKGKKDLDSRSPIGVGDKFRGNDSYNEQKTNSPQELPLGASRVDAFGAPYSNHSVEREAASRTKTLPEISELYLPIYSDQNLSGASISDFYAQFPQDTPQGKLYVLGSEISGSTGQERYKVLVYEQHGLQFKGAFETTASSQFPFQGLPTFEPRQATQFQESSRLLVFADTQANLHQLLSEESHVQAILKSAYHSSLDPQTFVGTDSQWNVDIYHVFPGIFLAEPLP
ncbi:MAG: hypothetical protein HYY62_02475 [Deltaproteobacteria bacterium]|nr:hypothetical protein [Deltaproteobacteria bacterium]